MRVVFSDQARQSLTDIGDYIALDSARQAQSFTRTLRAKAVSLRNAPRAFPLFANREDSGIRSRPFGSHLIFYRVEVNRILIVDILHGARDYEPLLFPPQ